MAHATFLRAAGLVALGITALLGACSTLVGADFDGLSPATGESGGSGGNVSAGGNVSVGGNASAGGNVSVGGSIDRGGTQGQAGGPVGGDGGGSVAEGGKGGHGGGANPNAGNGGVAGGGVSSGGAAGSGGVPNGGAAGVGGAPQAGASGAGGQGTDPVHVVLNELKGQGAGDDYIELYNSGPGAADLGGAYVTDNSTNRVTFPQGTTIPAKGYVVVRLGQPAATGMVTTCFGYSPCFDGVAWGIAASGEAIFFRDPQGTLIDKLTYPDENGPKGLANGQAYGRIPDGSPLVGAVTLTPGRANAAAK